MTKTDLTAERVRELLHYDPKTGEFTWRVSRGGGVKAGDIAGTINKTKGYRNIWIGGNYKAHRLAWLYVHGTWPEDQIDHINHVKTDNRIANLRPATNGQNMQNRPHQRNSPSGFKGVLGRSKSGRLPAKIAANGKQIWLGHFDSPELAYAAYCAAAARLHTRNLVVSDSHLSQPGFDVPVQPTGGA